MAGRQQVETQNVDSLVLVESVFDQELALLCGPTAMSESSRSRGRQLVAGRQCQVS